MTVCAVLGRETEPEAPRIGIAAAAAGQPTQACRYHEDITLVGTNKQATSVPDFQAKDSSCLVLGGEETFTTSVVRQRGGEV